MDTKWLKRIGAVALGGTVAFGLFSALRPAPADAKPPTGDAETEQNERRLQINKNGMLTLLGWSAANIGTGAAGWASADGRWQYFHQMNLLWNLVNAGIGGLGYAQATSEDPAGRDPIETIDKTRSMQQILALNAGLDLAYVAGGAWLKQRGGHRDDDRLLGYGDSVMLQGAFLLVFDAALWALHQSALADYKATIRPAHTDGPGALLHVEF